MFSNNPELKRNLWLEFTLHRLMGLPILALILYLSYILARNPIYSLTSLANTSLVLFVFLTLWGAKNCAASIIDEINQKTWDFQKLSALTPWQMTIGKFIGSSAYPWIGAILMLIAYGSALYLLSISPLDTPSNRYNSGIFKKYSHLTLSLILAKVTILFLTALLVQAVAMFGAASTLRDNKDKISSFNGVGFVVIAAIIGYMFLFLEQHIWGINDISHYRRYYRMKNIPEFISWYGTNFNAVSFIIFSLLAYVGWVMIGVYRTIKKELQYRLMPTMWCGFLLFTIIFLAGFLYKANTYRLMFAMSILLITITYTLTFMQQGNITTYRKLKHSLQHKQKRTFLENIPLWMPTFAMAATLSFLTCIYGLYYMDSSASQEIFRKHSMNNAIFNRRSIAIGPFFYVALFLTPLFMVMRDILIIHYFNLASNRKRANLTALLYLFLLYAVLPVLLFKLRLPNAAHMLVPFPIPPDYLPYRWRDSAMVTPWVSIIVACVQMTLVALLLNHKLRKKALKKEKA